MKKRVAISIGYVCTLSGTAACVRIRFAKALPNKLVVFAVAGELLRDRCQDVSVVSGLRVSGQVGRLISKAWVTTA